MTKSFQTFIWITGIFFLANLFFLNGFVSILVPFESNAIAAWGSEQSVRDLPGLVGNYLLENKGLDTNFLRLSGLSFFLFCLFAFVSLARPLFGRDTLLAFFLVLASSPIFILLTKLAIPDMWLAGAQLLATTFLLRCSKQTDMLWKIGFWISMLFGALIHPMMMFIWGLVFISALAIFHKNKSRFIQWPFGVGLIIPVIFYFIIPNPAGYLFSFTTLPFHYYLLGMLLFSITWFGFLLGGFRDMIWKLGKKEELSIIFLAWFLAGLATNGIILGLGFSLLIAKQLQLYFLSNYPRVSWVKTGSVLFLIASFFGAMLLIFHCRHYYGGAGFKAAIGVGGLFWMAGFWSILGIFSKDRSWVVGGYTFMGLIPVFIALVSLIPKFESENQWIKTVFVQEKDAWKNETLFIPENLRLESSKYETYAQLGKQKVTTDLGQATMVLEQVTDQTPNQVRAESFPLFVPEQMRMDDYVIRRK